MILISALAVEGCASSPARQSNPPEDAPPGPQMPAGPQVVVAPECDGPARSVPLPMRDSLHASFARIRAGRPPGKAIQDNYWQAGLARDVPGRFAGLYLGSPTAPYIGAIQRERRVVVLLADTTDVKRSLAALEPHLGPVMDTRQGLLNDAVVRKARWDFSQLLEWEHFLVPIVREVVGRRGFGSAVSVVRNRVRLSVPDSTVLRRLEARFAAMDLPCDLLHLEVGGRLVPTRGQAR